MAPSLSSLVDRLLLMHTKNTTATLLRPVHITADSLRNTMCSWQFNITCLSQRHDPINTILFVRL